VSQRTLNVSALPGHEDLLRINLQINRESHAATAPMTTKRAGPTGMGCGPLSLQGSFPAGGISCMRWVQAVRP